jgi:hypothetical protein
MAYVKTIWVDRNVQYPNRYTDELANTKTFTANPGTITEAGTPVTAAAMNNIGLGIDKLTDNTMIYGESSTGNDSYVITTGKGFTAYSKGMVIYFNAGTSNTGASTINVDNLGVKNLKVMNDTGKIDTITGNLINNAIYQATYDGTDFVINNPTILKALAFTASDNFTIWTGGGNINNSTPYTAITGTGVKVGRTGQYRYKYTHSVTSSASYAKLYQNGSPVGTESYLTGTASANRVEDITCNAGDTLQLYGYKTSGVNNSLSSVSISVSAWDIMVSL